MQLRDSDVFPALAVGTGSLDGRPLGVLVDRQAPEWDDLLGWQQSFAPGISRRGEAALFLGQLGYFLAAAMLESWKGNGGRPGVPAPVQVSYSLTHPDAGGRVAHVRIVGGEYPSGTWELLLRPVVEGLAERTGSSRGSLWRVAGDGIAAALLEFGRRRDCLSETCALFQSSLKRQESPLFNSQLQWPDSEAGVLERGGCCRLYEVGMALCPGCVLGRRQKVSTSA